MDFFIASASNVMTWHTSLERCMSAGQELDFNLSGLLCFVLDEGSRFLLELEPDAAMNVE